MRSSYVASRFGLMGLTIVAQHSTTPSSTMYPDKMTRTLSRAILAVVVAAVLGASARPARAEIGVGVFLGQPTGLDIKIDLQRRAALDIVIGWDDFDDSRNGYAHLTYLVGLGVARGRSVLIPFRLGIGGVIYGGGGGFDEVNLGVRAPFEIGFRFRRTPLEIYLEAAIKLTLVDDGDNNDNVDGDGGVGLRVYF